MKYVTKLLIAAVKSKQKDKAYQMWLVHFHHFVKKDKFIPFTDFYNDATSPSNNEIQKSQEDIMDDVELILHSLRGEQNGDI
ncbi:hypothetical protein GC096_03850 [Paenibacillus sp. LMG 31461]|uniref:Uncharacterized protein n=1 Tax=Paenibacillus plantarum TaxID=2654975 RepID=A0ABX1X455_9BACL|nr:hypothetical protein [Paenibacillus plantarum]NOU63179.1 hypothetical protein [Paenibacillus plantarum]